MLVVPTPRSAVCPHHGQGQCMHYTASGQQMSHKEKILYCFQPCKTCYHFSPKELSPRHRLGSGRQRWGGLVLTHLSQWPYVPSAVTWWEGTWVRAGCWEWGLPRSSSYGLSPPSTPGRDVRWDWAKGWSLRYTCPGWQGSSQVSLWNTKGDHACGKHVFPIPDVRFP